MIPQGRVAPASADQSMKGVFKMYNVGQETRYNPGGDKETSYMCAPGHIYI